MSQTYFYPPSSVSISAIGANGLPIPTDGILISGENPSGNLTPVQTDAAGNVIVDTATLGGATAANQVLEIGELTSANATLTSMDGSLSSIDTKLTAPLSVTGPLTDAELRATAVPVSGPLTDAELRATAVPVSGPLTDAELRATAVAVSVASLPLPSGAATEASLAAFSAKTAAAFVPEAYDYSAITYVGATTDINTVVYKSGGAAGVTVATLTMGYDGSNRLNSVTKS